MYDHCQWEEKAIRKLIGDGRIAARLKGAEDRSADGERECPICFLQYSEINVTKCCHANICTECYLQVRPQREKCSTCPFCNNGRLQVSVAQQMKKDQIKEREQNEQRVIEAAIRARTLHPDDDDVSSKITPEDIGKTGTQNEFDRSSGFGLSLEKSSMVAQMKSRSGSSASVEIGAVSNDFEIESLAMAPEERRRLEDEMRAQHSHPLALRIQAEAAERQLENERAYYRSQSAVIRDRSRRADDLSGGSSLPAYRRSRVRRSERDWNHIVDEFERGGNGEVQSIDDLVVLEAAILLSMEEEQRRARRGGITHNNFDAARHAREGFPLVRSFLASRRPADAGEGLPGDRSHEDTVGVSSSVRRSQLMRLGGYSTSLLQIPGNSSFDGSTLLMRGITEDEQVALAIAASLQEQSHVPPSPEIGAGNSESHLDDMEGLEAFVNEDEGAETKVSDESMVSEPENSCARNGAAGSPLMRRPSWAGDVAVGFIEESVDIDEMPDGSHEGTIGE